MSAPAVVRPGSTGEAVRDLQRRLGALGFEIPGGEAGRCGSVTEETVRTFQAARGIRVDGICGAETWAAVLDSGFRLGDRLLCIRQPMLRGDDVTELQSRLNALGFDAGKEDGIFGPNTARGLTEFQRNAGIAVDGTCGRESISALDRLGTLAAGAVAAARERDALRDPLPLAGRRFYVAAPAMFAPFAEQLVNRLLQAGTDTVLDTSTDDDAAIAAAANRYGADVFLAIRTGSAAEAVAGPGAVLRCCHYASGDFRSETGFLIASAVAAGLGDTLGRDSLVCGRAYTLLRETRMAAVVCELTVEGDVDGIRALDAHAERAAAAAVEAIRDALERGTHPGR